MDSDGEKQKKMTIVKVFRFNRPAGWNGRFDFEDFIHDTGLAGLLVDDENPTTRDELQRLYGDLTKLWTKSNLIKAVGHKTRKGQRGRKMVMYEPIVPLNFTFGDEGIYEETLREIADDLQQAMNLTQDAHSLQKTAYRCIEKANNILPK